jgi:hypothetical protein
MLHHDMHSTHPIASPCKESDVVTVDEREDCA